MSSAPSVTEVPAPVATETCVVCPHALADHDRISLRYCQATEAHSPDAVATRGCVCSS